jgi:hypothetical protein
MTTTLARLRDATPSPRAARVLTAAFVAITAVGVTVPSIGAFVPDGVEPIDYGIFGPAGAAILTGNLDAAFADPILQAGPLELIFWGIPYLLGVSGAVGWSIFTIIASSLIAVGTAWAAYRLLRLISPELAIPLATGVTALAALAGCLVTPVADGHPADAVVPALWIAAGLLARAGRPAAAAAVISCGAGWELWALLGVPLLLLVPRIGVGSVLRALGGGAVALGILFGPFVLAGPIGMFSFAWPIRDTSLVHLLLPDADEFTWPMRLAEALLAVGFGIAVALLVRKRIDAVWLVPLAVTSGRLLLDPLLAGYYFDTAAVLAFVGLGCAVAGRDLPMLIVAIALINGAITFRSLGWGSALILMVVIVAAVVVERRTAARHPGRVPGVSAGPAAVPASGGE